MDKIRNEDDLYVDCDYKIIYEEDSFLVVDKPAPLPVHPVGRFKEKNLLSLLGKVFPENTCRIVNRLDSETSGLVIVAKTKRSAADLAGQFERRHVEKEYTGIVFGVFRERKGAVCAPLGAVKTREHHSRAILKEGDDAETEYQVLGECRSAEAPYSEIRLFPKTGRTHQIRVHLASIGHPLVGDKLYIDDRIFDRYVKTGWQDDMLAIVKMPRLALHASGLKFRHPENGEALRFASKLPEIFRKFLNDHSIVDFKKEERDV